MFYAVTGRPLTTAGNVATIVKQLVSDADVEIGPGLSEEDLVEIRYRGVLDISNAQQQLRYAPRFAAVRDGIADYIETYRRCLSETA